jgi:hypothetical protein
MARPTEMSLLMRETILRTPSSSDNPSKHARCGAVKRAIVVQCRDEIGHSRQPPTRRVQVCSRSARGIAQDAKRHGQIALIAGDSANEIACHLVPKLAIADLYLRAIGPIAAADPVVAADGDTSDICHSKTKDLPYQHPRQGRF